ncbi:hypothetical protein CRYUN_Cryun01aG0253300 [Craigia yunnanensis]
MDPRLFEAARSGNISAFQSLQGEDPFILDRVALNSVDNPLLISALTGQTEIKEEHGKDGKVPLHCTALKGRVDVVKELIWASPESLKEVTACGETALHLAVKSNQIEAARILGQEALVSGVNVNAMNSSGFTPKDVLDLLLQNGVDFHDIHIYQMFQQAGAVKAREITTDPAYFQAQVERFNNTQIMRSSCSWNLWKELMKEVSESSNETQNALMVVAVLIATVTYQAILSPPRGFWQAEKEKSPTNTVQKRTMMPGEAVMASGPEIFAVFTVFNAVGFFASLAMISLLTSGFTLRAGLRLAILSMTIWGVVPDTRRQH